MPRRSDHLFAGSKKGKGYDTWEQADMKDEGGIFLAGYSRRGSNPLDIFPLRGAKASRRIFFAARRRSPRRRLNHMVRTRCVRKEY